MEMIGENWKKWCFRRSKKTHFSANLSPARGLENGSACDRFPHFYEEVHSMANISIFSHL